MECGTPKGVRIACVVAGAVCAALGGVAFAVEPGFEETRIPHHDGSGRSTIVEIAPGVPGARELVRPDDRAPPAPGELSLPTPTPLPCATPSPCPTPARRHAAGAGR